MITRKLLLFLCLAALPTQLAAQSKPTVKTKPSQTKPAASVQRAAVAPKPKPKPKPSSIVDAEFSGINNEISDTLFARLRVQKKFDSRQWYLRTTYRFVSTESVSGNKIVTTKTSTTRLDAEWRRNFRRHYNFLAATYNVRGRNPSNRTYPAVSGYYLAYAGKGRQVAPKFETGLGLGVLHDYDDGTRTAPAVVVSLQGQVPITRRFSFDTQILAIQPTNNGFKVDSEAALQYQLMQGLFLRLGHSATNLIRPNNNTGDWNKTWRLSLLVRYSS